MSDRHRGMSDRQRDARDARDAREHKDTRDAREHTGVHTSIQTLTLYVNASMSMQPTYLYTCQNTPTPTHTRIRTN